MKKDEYMNRVAEIFETLAFAIQDFKDGKIDDEEMQSIIRKAWDDKPKGWMLVDMDLAETLELDEDKIGKVISSKPYDNIEFQNEMIDTLIAEVPFWKEDTTAHGRLSVYGSGSLIPAIIGEAEWEYLR